jgi:hypothetical protein
MFAGPILIVFLVVMENDPERCTGHHFLRL